MSFAHLPEYSDDVKFLRRPSIATSLSSSYSEDPNTVVLERFEDVARRVTSKEPASPLLTRVKVEEGEDRYMQQFKQVVWPQIAPSELSDPDKSSVSLFEREAQTFPPVSRFALSRRR